MDYWLFVLALGLVTASSRAKLTRCLDNRVDFTDFIDNVRNNIKYFFSNCLNMLDYLYYNEFKHLHVVLMQQEIHTN